MGVYTVIHSRLCCERSNYGLRKWYGM